MGIKHRSKKTKSCHYHLLAGLVLASEIFLPELAPLNDVSKIDVYIRKGIVPRSLENAKVVTPTMQITYDECLLRIPEIATFHIMQGRKIVFQPENRVYKLDVRIFLMSTVMGALFYQRKFIPLHICAIEANGQCLAFTGKSGAGKSTLALALHQRGFKIFSDDLCMTDLYANEIKAYLGFNKLKVWKDAFDALNIPTKSLEKIRPGFNKYYLSLKYHKDFPPSLPLTRIYYLHPTRKQEVRIKPLRNEEALAAFDKTTFRRVFLFDRKLREEHFARCAQAVSLLKLYQLKIPRDLQSLPKVVDYLQDHWQQEQII